MTSFAESKVLSDIHLTSGSSSDQGGRIDETCLSRFFFYFSMNPPDAVDSAHLSGSQQQSNTNTLERPSITDKDIHETDNFVKASYSTNANNFSCHPSEDKIEQDGCSLTYDTVTVSAVNEQHLTQGISMKPLLNTHETAVQHSDCCNELEVDTDGDSIVARKTTHVPVQDLIIDINNIPSSSFHEDIFSPGPSDALNADDPDRSTQLQSHKEGKLKMNVCLKRHKELEVITIEHKMATHLQDVGFQVWAGALFLCDYILSDRGQSVMKGASVLDLGAGSGITSIMTAIFASSIICTDYRADIVSLAERNWHRNHWLLPRVTTQDITFRVLDWTSDNLFVEESTDENACYALREDDKRMFDAVNVILAAEVVYDEDLTDAFFKTLFYLLLEAPEKEVFITVEKRIVFQTQKLTMCSPAYEHFRENLEDLTTVDEGPMRFYAEQISNNFPQYFQYRRSKEMELWKISSKICKCKATQLNSSCIIPSI